MNAKTKSKDLEIYLHIIDKYNNEGEDSRSLSKKDRECFTFILKKEISHNYLKKTIAENIYFFNLRF